MKPKRLIISGWGPYKEKAEINFEAFEGKGIFLVTGATGAGKTTIFDAISYALYGRLSGEVREKSSVRSDFAAADTPTFVELFMTHDGRQYHIVRNPEYVRPRKKGEGVTKEKENAVLYEENGNVLEGVKEVNARMQEILVLDYGQFKQLTMIAQGEFARLLNASPKEKTAIFRDIFGTGTYENFTRLLREKAKLLFHMVQEYRHKLEEDMKLFLMDNDGELISVKELSGLVEEAYLNHDAIQRELKRICRAAQKEESELENQNAVWQEENRRLAAEVTQKELENARIEKLQTERKNLKELEEKRAFHEEKKQILKRAREAAEIEPCRMKAENAKKRQAEKQDALNRSRKRKKELEEEYAQLQVFVNKQMLFKQYLTSSALLEEGKRTEKEQKKKLEAVLTDWEKAKQAFEKTYEEREKKKQCYEETEKRFRFATVGIVAGMLKKGEPCPVCGSMEHPNPAKTAEDLPSEEELKKRKQDLEKAEKQLAVCQEEAVSLRTKAEELEKTLENLHSRNAGQKQEKENCLQAMDLEEWLKQEICEKASYKELENLISKKTERALQAETSVLEETGILNRLVREEAEEAKEAAACQEEWLMTLHKAGFEKEADCENALLSKTEMQALEREMAEYEQTLAATKRMVLHLEETVCGREIFDMSGLLKQTEEAKEKQLAIQENSKQLHAFLADVRKTMVRFEESRKKMQDAEAEYGYVGELANLASGNNTRRLVFEQYVLAGYFEEILHAANLRFYQMTGGRYEMLRIREAGDGRIKDSLEIQVMDYYTGRQRSVKTLSGGESFKASLALALGMSDVVQAMCGGIKVETMFIDEGFGALDGESLDQACETLMGLAENNRLIGIISHVQELREKIDSQIIIDKTNDGSNVKIRV